MRAAVGRGARGWVLGLAEPGLKGGRVTFMLWDLQDVLGLGRREEFDRTEGRVLVPSTGRPGLGCPYSLLLALQALWAHLGPGWDHLYGLLESLRHPTPGPVFSSNCEKRICLFSGACAVCVSGLRLCCSCGRVGGVWGSPSCKVPFAFCRLLAFAALVEPVESVSLCWAGQGARSSAP